MRREVAKPVDHLGVDIAMRSLTGPVLQDATGRTSTYELGATGGYGARTPVVALLVRPRESADDDASRAAHLQVTQSAGERIWIG